MEEERSKHSIRAGKGKGRALRQVRKRKCKQCDRSARRKSKCSDIIKSGKGQSFTIVQELCESRGGRLRLSVLTSLLVSVDVKIY